MSMDEPLVKRSQDARGVVTLTLNRPQAYNALSEALLSALQGELDSIAADTMVPVIGVIEPGARAAVKASRNGKIGVIGTEATIASGAHLRNIRSSGMSMPFTRLCALKGLSFGPSPSCLSDLM